MAPLLVVVLKTNCPRVQIVQMAPFSSGKISSSTTGFRGILFSDKLIELWTLLSDGVSTTSNLLHGFFFVFLWQDWSWHAVSEWQGWELDEKIMSANWIPSQKKTERSTFLEKSIPFCRLLLRTLGPRSPHITRMETLSPATPVWLETLEKKHRIQRWWREFLGRFFMIFQHQLDIWWMLIYNGCLMDIKS